MSVKRTPKGETTRRIYSVLKRNPDLTAYEVHKHLPDLTYAAVCCAITAMQKKGTVASRGARTIQREGKQPHKCNTYHVKYKAEAKAEPKRKLKTQVKPVVKQVKPKRDMAAEYEALYREQFERHGNTLEQLHNTRAAYERTVELLIETLDDLAETKQALEDRRNWWDAVKGWFA